MNMRKEGRANKNGRGALLAGKCGYDPWRGEGRRKGRPAGVGS